MYDRIMSRSHVIVGLAAVLAAGVVWTRCHHREAAVTETQPTASAPMTTITTTPKVTPPTTPTLPTSEATNETPPDPTINGTGIDDVTHELDTTRENLVRVARDCSGLSQLDRKQTLHVRMSLTIVDGVGRIAKPTILDGTLEDKAIRTCVLEGFRKASWPSPSHDGEIMFESRFTVGELLR